MIVSYPLRQLAGALPARRRGELGLVVVLMLAGGVAELATLGTLVPFLALLAGGGTAFPAWLPRVGPASAVLLFVGAMLAATALRLALHWSTQRLVYGVGHDVSVEIQRRLLMQPYGWHLEQHSSEALAALEKVQHLTFSLLLPLLQGLVAGVVALFILAALIAIEGRVVLVAAAGLGLGYALIGALIRRRLARNAAVLGPAYDRRVRYVQESLGGIRDILIDGTQGWHVERFRAIDRQLAEARLRVGFYGAAPRYLIEAVAIILVASIALWLSRQAGGLASAIPALGALALGGQRLLPLMQQVYQAVSGIGGQRSLALDIAALLALPAGPPPERATPLPFHSALRLERLRFAYPGRARPAIDGLDLVIPAGSRVALVGRSGAGKSTLADLVMGLLRPDEGRILVDDVLLDASTLPRWQAGIAHVPQHVFVADASLTDNIALGAGPVDPERVRDALDCAQLGAWVQSLPDGAATMAGENGVRLSGGQRQRIGLARAIYKQAPLLILDEPTSALDAETEEAVLQVLDNLQRQGRTILIISHRPSSIAGSDLVIRLDQGRIA